MKLQSLSMWKKESLSCGSDKETLFRKDVQKERVKISLWLQ